MSLDTESAFFEEHRAELLKHHGGKFVLIRGQTLHGVYDTHGAAYKAGVGLWGNVPFLVKLILPEDPVEESPAFVYGLLHVNS